MRLSIVVLAGAVMLGAMATLSTAVQACSRTTSREDGPRDRPRGVGPYAFAWVFAIIALATGVAAMRSAMLPGWYAWLSIAAAAWFVVSGLTYADSGFFSPSGGFGFIGLLAFLAWVLLTSGLMLRRGMAAEAPMAATAPMLDRGRARLLGAPVLLFLVLVVVGVLGLVRQPLGHRIVLREVAPGLLHAHAR